MCAFLLGQAALASLDTLSTATCGDDIFAVRPDRGKIIIVSHKEVQAMRSGCVCADDRMDLPIGGYFLLHPYAMIVYRESGVSPTCLS